MHALFPRANQNVCLQMALGDEGLATAFEGTREGPVVGVRSHVCLQVTRLRELLDTLRVGTEKHSVRRRGTPQHLKVSLPQWQSLVVRPLLSVNLRGLLGSLLVLV